MVGDRLRRVGCAIGLPLLVGWGIACSEGRSDQGSQDGSANGSGGAAATGSGGSGPAGSGGSTAGSGGSAAGSGGSATGGAPGSGGRGPGSGGSGTGGAAGSTASPAPGQYGTRAVLPASNSEMAIGEAAGKIYVVGGYPSNRTVQSTVQVYDPATNTWALTTPHPTPIHHPVVVGVAGKLYSLGGQVDMGGMPDTNRTFVFDPALSTWSELQPMPTARGAGAGAAIDDKIYVVGGRPPAGNAFEVYDISDNAWTPLPDLPQTYPNRNHLAAVAIAGKIYVAGGRYNGGSVGDPRTDSLDIFDPVAGGWTTGMPMPRVRGGNNGVAAYGCFYTWGGEGNNIGEPNNVYPDHDVYNPRTNTWTSLPDLPTPVHGVTGAVFLNGLIYMPGGGTSSGGSSGSTIFQVFRPDPAMRCDM